MKMKKDSPFSSVRKVCRVNGMTGGVYANAMTKAIGEQYFPGPRRWGTRVKGLPIVEHKGKKYLELHVIRTLSTKYYVGDREVSLEEIAPYAYKQSEPAVKWRDYSFDSIKEVNIDGQHFDQS